LKLQILACFAFLTFLAGCTSFAVYLDVPGTSSADVAFYASAVKSVKKIESGEVIRLSSSAWRIKLKNSKGTVILPFVPSEMIISVKAENTEGVIRLESSEDTQGKTAYKAKAMTESAASWKVTIAQKDNASIEITIDTKK